MHMNTHINTTATEHRENIKAMKTQKFNTTKYQYIISFNIFIQRSNNERFFYANQHNNQATENDDRTDADHLYS